MIKQLLSFLQSVSKANLFRRLTTQVSPASVLRNPTVSQIQEAEVPKPSRIEANNAYLRILDQFRKEMEHKTCDECGAPACGYRFYGGRRNTVCQNHMDACDKREQEKRLTFLEPVRRAVDNCEPGWIAATVELKKALEFVWPALSQQHSTPGFSPSSITRFEWQPPVLRFDIWREINSDSNPLDPICGHWALDLNRARYTLKLEYDEKAWLNEDRRLNASVPRNSSIAGRLEKPVMVARRPGQKMMVSVLPGPDGYIEDGSRIRKGPLGYIQNDDGTRTDEQEIAKLLANAPAHWIYLDNIFDPHVGPKSDGVATGDAKSSPRNSGEYPKPDRSTFRPNFKKTPEEDHLDISWAEGTLSDGRPYRAEYWCQDQTGCLTVFLSVIGLEDAFEADFLQLLERENLLKFKSSERRSLSALLFRDPSGNQLWSLNLVVDDEDRTYVDVRIPFQRYDRSAYDNIQVCRVIRPSLPHRLRESSGLIKPTRPIQLDS